MTASPPLDPIPVYIGDDWSFAFTCREGGGNGAPVDLTGCTVLATLYPPFIATGTNLVTADGQAGLIDAIEGKIGVGVHRILTAAYVPAPKGAVLQISILDAAGRQRTLAVWPLWVLTGRDQLPTPLVNRVVTDPISGNTLTFDGPTDLFPFLPDDSGALLSVGISIGNAVI